MPAIRIEERNTHDFTHEVTGDETWACKLLKIFIRKDVRPNG